MFTIYLKGYKLAQHETATQAAAYVEYLLGQNYTQRWEVYRAIRIIDHGQPRLRFIQGQELEDWVKAATESKEDL